MAKKMIAEPERDEFRPSPHMIGQIVSAYGLGSLQVEGDPLEGTGYVTYRAVTPKGVFALRRKKGSASKIMAKHPDIGSSIEGQHNLTLFLHEHGFPVAPPLLTRDKETYVNITGIPWGLYPFIDGEPLEPTNLNQLRAAAQTLARYHKLTQKYQGEPPISQESFPELFEEAVKEFRKNSAALDDLTSELGVAESLVRFKQTLSQIEPELKVLPYESLPHTVIHGDYKPGNILFEGDDVAAVIDFGRSRNEARLFDIAKTIGGLVGTSNDETCNEMISVIVTAYDGISPLDELERSNLVLLVQARLAIKALDRLARLIEEKEDPENLERAERFRLLVNRLAWVGANGEAIRKPLTRTVNP